MRNETGGVIVGYFTKIAVVLAAFGVLSFDAAAVGIAKMNAQDTATEAAQMGSEQWAQDHSRTTAFRAAEAYAQEHGATIDVKSFRIEADGTVWVTLTKEATTLLFYRVSASRKWTRITASGHGRTV